MRTLFWRRHPAVILPIVVLLVSALVLAIPPARTVAQETLERVVPLYCVIHTGQGYVVYEGTRGPLGLMRWKPVTPVLPPSPQLFMLEWSMRGVCPEGSGAILWGYAKMGLLLAGLLIGVMLLVYRPARAKMIRGIRTLGGWVWRLREEYPVRTLLWQRHPALTLATVVLVALLVITLAWPGALTAAAQGIENFVQRLWLGPHTTVHQVSPERAAAHPRKPAPATSEVKQRSDGWTIRTAIGNFGGNLVPGWDATVRRFGAFDEAQVATLFNLRRPGYLPTDYALREAMIAPGDWTFLFYDGPEGDIILVQMPVYDQVEERSDNQVVTTAFMIGTLTDKPIEEVTLNGQPAGWVEGHSLMWEADGVSYTLGGASLSLDEATRIAESLE